MYDQILTKTARPGGWEQGEGMVRGGKKEERGITRFNKFREEAKPFPDTIRIIADRDSRN